MSGIGTNFLGVPFRFLNNVAPEVGGAGVDILVGAFGGWVASKVALEKSHRRLKKFLDWRRTFEPKIFLSEVFQRETADLSLHGFIFENEGGVKDFFVYNCRFVTEREKSQFCSVVISSCKFERCRFGSRSNGTVFKESPFENCFIEKCDFRNCRFIGAGGSDLFSGSTLASCDFRNCVFRGMSFENSEIRDGKFWGARFIQGAKMPKGVFDQFEQWNAIEIADDEVRVFNLREFLFRKDSKRMVFFVFQINKFLQVVLDRLLFLTSEVR